MNPPSSFDDGQTVNNQFLIHRMVRLEQITAIALAAGLAIPSYWFFWTLAGGGGYERRGVERHELIQKNQSSQIPQVPKDLLSP